MSKQSGSHYSKHAPSKAYSHTLAVELGNELPIPLSPPPKTHYDKASFETKDQPPLEFGKRAIVRINDGGDCKGYLGCVVVDWNVIGTNSMWSMSTQIIFQVIGISQPEFRDMIGRLICCNIYSWSSSFGGGFGIVEMTGKNWSKYKIQS